MRPHKFYIFKCRQQSPYVLLLTIAIILQLSSHMINAAPENAEQQQNAMGDLSEQIQSPVAAKAFAAPINRQQQQGNSVMVNGEHKPFFKIHYRDGIQKAIFDETPRRVPADFEDNNDVGGDGGREFDAYDETRLVDPRHEVPLFIPFLYRNESEEEQQSSSSATTLAPTRTQRPLVAPEILQSRQPVLVRTTTQGPFGRPTPSIRPAQPFGRPQPPQQQQFLRPQQPQFPPQQPQFPPQQPQFPPQQPQFPQQQQGFLPPPPPQQFRPLPQQPQQPQLPPQPRLPPPPPPSSPPQQPQQLPLPRPSQPQPQQQPQQPQLPRPQQPPQPPPPAPAQQPANLRTGVCQHTIFYTPQQVTGGDVQRIYTHFAVVVSVDQCARTCHEFNCDVAILDPRTRHCQFNPSTSFGIPATCPQWPNRIFRNNVPLADELIKITCVTCQQRRRGQRPVGAQQIPANLPPSGNVGQQQQTFSLRRPQAQPQFVLRTTTRDRIGNANLNGNNLNAAPIQRVANAAKTKKFASANINDDEPQQEQQQQEPREEGGEQGEEQKNLSEEFHKLERLLKSAEDYLDETGGRRKSGSQRRNIKSGKGREVPSWTEGHPQGDGHSPLKINPLRRPAYFTDHIRPQPIFYSTDRLQQQQRQQGKGLEEDEELLRKRIQRREAASAEMPHNNEAVPEGVSFEGTTAVGKPKLNSAGSVKLQAQEPAGLRELPNEKLKVE